MRLGQGEHPPDHAGDRDNDTAVHVGRECQGAARCPTEKRCPQLRRRGDDRRDEDVDARHERGIEGTLIDVP